MISSVTIETSLNPFSVCKMVFEGLGMVTYKSYKIRQVRKFEGACSQKIFTSFFSKLSIHVKHEGTERFLRVFSVY